MIDSGIHRRRPVIVARPAGGWPVMVACTAFRGRSLQLPGKGWKRLRLAMGLVPAVVCLQITAAAPAEGQVLAGRTHVVASAGLYGAFAGSPGGLNGPVLGVSVTEGLLPWLGLGGRLEFRDDDDGGGRSQAINVSFEARLRPIPAADGLSIPIFMGLDGVRTRDIVGAPDVPSGLYGRIGVGLGLEWGVGAQRPYLEGRTSWGRAGRLVSVTVGMASRPAGKPAWGYTALLASQLRPAGRTYDRDPIYPGYAITVQQTPGPRWPVRASLGVDFLKFPGVSTGVVHLLGGSAVRLTGSRDRTVTVLAVGQAGALFFLEPSSGPVSTDI
jgi:hypothetical protein